MYIPLAALCAVLASVAAAHALPCASRTTSPRPPLLTPLVSRSGSNLLHRSQMAISSPQMNNAYQEEVAAADRTQTLGSQ